MGVISVKNVELIAFMHSHQHIIVEAEFGGKQTERYKYTYAEMYEYASTHVRLLFMFHVLYLPANVVITIGD